MTQAESSEEANHFEQVLGRLDALLKRNQPLSVPPVEAVPAVTAEATDGDLPVLTEVYEGEVAAVFLANAEDLPAPLLTEAVDVPEQPFEESMAQPSVAQPSMEQPSMEQPMDQAAESAQSPEAYVGSLDAISPDEALPPSATVDSDVVVERTVTVLMPLLQETLDRVVGEEIERALGQVRACLAERLHGEIREEIEWVLRERLREVLTEGRD